MSLSFGNQDSDQAILSKLALNSRAYQTGLLDFSDHYFSYNKYGLHNEDRPAWVLTYKNDTSKIDQRFYLNDHYYGKITLKNNKIIYYNLDCIWLGYSKNRTCTICRRVCYHQCLFNAF